MLLGISIFAYIVISILNHSEAYLYQTSLLLFFIGAFFNNKFKIVEFSKQKITALIGLCVFIVMLAVKENLCSLVIINFIYTTAMTAIFTLSIIGIGLPQLLNNQVCKFLGMISLEIYGIHGAFITIYRSRFIYITNDILFVLALFISTVVIALGVNKVFLMD